MDVKKILIGIALLTALSLQSHAMHYEARMLFGIVLAVIAAIIGLIAHGGFNFSEGRKQLKWWQQKLITDYQKRMACAQAYAAAHKYYGPHDRVYYVYQRAVDV